MSQINEIESNNSYYCFGEELKWDGINYNGLGTKFKQITSWWISILQSSFSLQSGYTRERQVQRWETG